LTNFSFAAAKEQIVNYSTYFILQGFVVSRILGPETTCPESSSTRIFLSSSFCLADRTAKPANFPEFLSGIIPHLPAFFENAH
jgi:hypothetical protein